MDGCIVTLKNNITYLNWQLLAKMPASGGDTIGSALRFGFSAGNKLNGNIDNSLDISGKRVLQTQIKMEAANNNYKSKVLTSLKSKYTVINTKVSSNCPEKAKGLNKKVPTLPVPKTILFPTEKVELGFRSSLPVGSGMFNLGNTCYLNSTLQALFHVPAFVNWLLAEPAHHKCEQYGEYQIHSDDITCAVIKTLKCSHAKTGTAMKPTCIYYKLKTICKHLSQGSQEDAHEFMRYLLECIEKGYLTKVQGHNLESWSKETTPINQIFGGYIRSEVACLHCHAVSTTFQHFQDLPLDIRKASNLNDALSGYFARETLPGGDDAYKCEKCCRKVEATKKFSVERPPNVLCVQLKRFSSMNGKLTKPVELPRLLDLSPFMSCAVQPRHAVLYRLVSMVTHMGQSANCGHYTAIALAPSGSYYHFDDGCVRQIGVNAVQNMSAYVVLYELERPFQPYTSRPATSTETCAQKESESASTGGSDAKEPRRSPTAGSPAPRTSPNPTLTALTSLVPYDSDADSDSDRDKVNPPPLICKSVSKPTALSTTTWRVTDLNPPGRSADSGKNNNGGPLRASNLNGCVPPRHPGQVPATSTASDAAGSADKSKSNVVNELLQNSHLGYGSNQIKTWCGASNAMGRQIEEEKKESRKRTYDDEYNAEFDRGKAKKPRHMNGPRDNGRRYDQNPFQRKANEFNMWQRRSHDYNSYKPKWNNNWKDRRAHKNHYRPYYSHY